MMESGEEGAGNDTVPLSCGHIKELAADLPLYQDAHTMSNIWQPIIIALGIMGNILIFLVMMQRSYRRNSCANYIAALAFSDSVALARKSVDDFQMIRGTTYSHNSCGAWVYVALSACQMSTFLVVCMTIDRLILVRFPTRSVTYCKPRTARRIMAICFIIVVIFNIPHVFLTEPVGENKYCATFRAKEWQDLAVPYGILQALVNYVIPCISLVIMTIMIITALRKNRQRHNKLSEKLTEIRGSLSNNIITNISTDGLFHYVISYAAYNLFEKKNKKKMKNEASKKDDVLTRETGGEVIGSVNKAFTTEPEDGNTERENDKTEKTPENDKTDKTPDRYSRQSDILSELDERENGEKNKTNLQNTETPEMERDMKTKRDLEEEMNDSNRENQASSATVTINMRNKNDKNTTLSQSDTPNALAIITSPNIPNTRREQYQRQESKARKKKDSQLSFLLLLVVFFFLILTSLQYIRYLIFSTKLVDECQDRQSYAFYFLMYIISSKLYFTNCAINFFIYLFGSSLFRSNLKYLFVGAFKLCGKFCSKRGDRESGMPEGVQSETSEQRNIATQFDEVEKQSVSTQTVSVTVSPTTNNSVLDTLEETVV